MLKLSKVIAVSAAIAASVSCGNVVRDSRSPVLLEVVSLAGSRGGPSPGPFGTGVIFSDVITNVTSPAPCSATTPCPTIFADNGQVVLRTIAKDVASPSAPTTNNDVTITRYHVQYARSDGRNVEGVDIPYAYDGATTGTVPAGGTSATLGFELVKSIAKEETPLVQLKTSASVIGVIATVTFYGRDQVGNELSAVGAISIEFANFGDTQ